MADFLFGWFDDPSQTTPAYDPPHDAPCLFCGSPIHADDVQTHSIMMSGSAKSYFYRTHKTCAETNQSSLDGIVFAMIEKNGQ
jgi:hypothetical protein